MAKLKLALFGAGMIGRSHAAILARLPDQIEFVGIADPCPDAAALAASLGVRHFAEIEKLLDATRPDAAIVATPNVLHAPHAHACIDRGVAILVEKPLAEDVATALAIANHAASAGVALLVGQFRRHNPLVATARRVIGEGRLGRLVTISASSTVLKPEPYFETAWRRVPGGGPILINLVHDIDVLRHLCGEIDSVQAITSNALRGYPVEDTAAVLLQFSSGALGTLVLSDTAASPFCWDQSAGENPAFPQHDTDAYRISGTDATLELPSLKLWRYPGARGWTERLECQRIDSQTGDPLERQTLHFLRVVRGDEPPLVSGADGARTVAATLAVARSGAERRAIRVDDMMT